MTALAYGSEHLWAVVDAHEIWRRKNEWETVATIPHGVNCLLPAASGVYAGTKLAHLFRISDGHAGIVESFDATEGRDEWYTPWGGPPDVRSIAEAPTGSLFANVHVGGILRSRDAGNSWQPTIDIHADVHEVVAGGETVLAATARGLVISHDDGNTWRFEDRGLHATYARAVARGGDTVLLTVSNGPRGGRAAIYRRPVHGDQPFERCTAGLPEWFDHNIDTGCVAQSQRLVTFGTRDGRVFASSDVGATWEEILSGLSPVRWVEFTPRS